MSPTSILPSVLLVFATTTLACGSGARASRPSFEPTPVAFSAAGAEPVPDHYWRAFSDPTLDALVNEALVGNPGLLATWSRIEQASAVARRDGATRLPTLGASASGSGSVRGDTDGASGQTQVSLGLTASYEVDLWGRLDAAREASELGASASLADLRAAGISLSALVTSTWFDIVVTRQELALLDAQLADEREVERLIGLRAAAGMVPQTDLLRQRQQVEAIRGDRELATAQLVVLEHSLAVLRGRAPTVSSPPSRALPSLPPLPDTGVPAEIVNRRPDVLRRLIDIEIADRRVAIAIADKFPTLKLTASMGATGTVYELLANFASSLVSGLAAPIIDGGRRSAEADRTRAALVEKVYLYRETVLQAMREVEDALVRESQQGSYIKSLGAQLEIAVAVRARVDAAYAAGTVDALDLLVAGDAQRSLERRLLAAHRSLLEYRLALYRALAGGWSMTRPASTPNQGPNDDDHA